MSDLTLPDRDEPDMSRIAPFEPDDFDWALGELYHLAEEAGRARVFPPFYNPALFHACWHFATAQPLEVRQQILKDFTRIYMHARVRFFRDYFISR